MRRIGVFGSLILAVHAFGATPPDDRTSPPPPPDPFTAACGQALVGDVPALAPVGDDALAVFAYKTLEYPIFTLSAERLNALLAHMGVEYEARRKFAEEAMKWPPIEAWALSSSYTIGEWLESVKVFQRIEEDFQSGRGALAAYEADSASNGEVLAKFQKERERDLDDLNTELRMLGPKALNRGFWDRLNLVKAQLAALRVVAFRTRRPEARFTAELLEKAWLHHVTLSAYVEALANVRGNAEYPSIGPSMTRRLAAMPFCLNDVTYLLTTGATEAERAEIVFQTFTGQSYFAGNQWHFLDPKEVHTVVERWLPEALKPEAVVSLGKSHPLVDRLARLAGAAAEIELVDGQKMHVRLQRVTDWSADQEGTVAGLYVINAAGQSAVVGLDLARRIQVAVPPFVYDAAVDGKIPLRSFGLSPELRERLENLTTKHHGFVDDALVHRDEVVLAAKWLVAHGPVPEGAERWVEDFRALVDVRSTDPQRLDIVRDSVAARVVAAYAKDLELREVGPRNRHTLNYVAVSMYLERGGKAWGIDVGRMLREGKGGDAVARALTAAAAHDYPEFKIIGDPDPAVRHGFVAMMEERGGLRFAEAIARFVRVVDVRWKPTIERLCAGSAPESIVFLEGKQACLANQTQRFLATLLTPDSAPFGLDKDKDRLRFLSDALPSVLGPIGRRNKAALLAALDAIATAPTRTSARALQLEQAIRAEAGALKAALEAETDLPWEAMDLPK